MKGSLSKDKSGCFCLCSIHFIIMNTHLSEEHKQSVQYNNNEQRSVSTPFLYLRLSIGAMETTRILFVTLQVVENL